MMFKLFHLHPLDRFRRCNGLMDEVCVLHVLRQTLQEAERFVENDRHCDLGELLKGTGQGVERQGFITKRTREFLEK